MATRKNMSNRKLARQQRAFARFSVQSPQNFNGTAEEYAAYVQRVTTAQANLAAKIGA